MQEGCRKEEHGKSAAVLKEATLFILTTQLFRHLLPGKKYLPYENVILSMAVLSILIVPILSVADADFPGEFGERVALLETENEMFSQHLEKLEEQETGLFRNNMADSIEVRVQKEAEAAGVRVYGLSGYYIHQEHDHRPSTVVLGYASLSGAQITRGAEALLACWGRRG